ncbi:MAG: hypothetical protein HYU58_12350 [Proteobacteria bacterium]|nr:hypothetical protein [Pseudomonadota bacterium]
MPKRRAVKPKIDARVKKAVTRNAVREVREASANAALTVTTDQSVHRKAVAAAITTHLSGIAPLRREIAALQVRQATKSAAAEAKRAKLAIKTSRGRKAALAAITRQRVAAFEALAAVDVPNAPRYLVNTPFEIAGSGLNLSSFAAVPSNSWAKFRMEKKNTSQRRYGSVVFKFIWQNAGDKYAVINVHGYLILHGHCYVWSDGGIFGGDRTAGITIKPTLTVNDWTNEPYLQLARTDTTALEIRTDTGTVWDDAAEDMADIFRGYDLSQELILVPPRTSVGLVMSAELQYYAGQNSGIVQANFADGAFMVGSPAVLVTLVS